jgi:tetratricopeptide (TPR) repeat protein
MYFINRIFLFLSMVIVLSGPVSGQTKKDSLWGVWNDPTAADTNRLKAIQALTWPMLSEDLDSAYVLANLQLNFAKEKNQKKWIAKAYYNIATHYYLKSDFVKSLSFYQESLKLRKELGDLKGEAAIYGNLGLIYGQQGNTLKDLEYQLKSLAINERINDTANLTSNFANLAVIYQNQEDSTKALEYYYRALRMHEAQNDRRNAAILYNNIGTMYRSFGLYNKALEYLQKSLEIRTELNDKLGMSINYVNLGTTYISMREFEKARENTLQSIKLFEEYGDTASLANAYFNLGDISLKEKKFLEAIKWCDASFKIAESVNKVPIEQASSSCLYRAYKEIGDYKKSLEYFEDYVVFTDSLNEEELKIELSRIEFEKDLLADSLKREDEKNTMQLSHQKELTRKNRITYIILFIAFGVLILALIFMSRMFFFQRNSEVFKRKTQELEKQHLVNEISLLKTQVNPHFLFNSLSILSSLVRIDPDLSEKFIDQLSRSYRYILEQKDQSLVTLRTELGFIESYAFLLKIRFENKFDLKIDLPEEILDKYKIAPLTLQLLIENAVKHNRMSVSEPLIVNINLENKHVLVVKNKLQPRSTPTKSTGVGLQNIINRYALLTDKHVWAGETQDQFVIKIPLLNETA